MRPTVLPTFAALLASARALPSPQDEVKVIPPWKLEAEWCCAWIAGDYIGTRPNWCRDNGGVSLCCVPIFPWNGGADQRGACLNPSFPYRRALVVYNDNLNPVRERQSCSGYDGGLTWRQLGYGMCMRQGST
ncbi:hypothetical protein PTMSG1_10514 [Pyrenophora teres f. maculata]|nr:hypothetical protein PTMSG1_10514 [Pyrenophora teres f. maculata]